MEGLCDVYRLRIQGRSCDPEEQYRVQFNLLSEEVAAMLLLHSPEDRREAVAELLRAAEGVLALWRGWDAEAAGAGANRVPEVVS